MRAVLRIACVLAWGIAFTPISVADDEGPVDSLVVLKSGRVIRGSVTGSKQIGDTEMSSITTDFGTILVPTTHVRKTSATPRADDTFRPSEVRVSHVEGQVERLPEGEDQWLVVPSAMFDEYGHTKPPPVVMPGDTIRTGKDGVIDLILHADVWLRVLPESELEIADSKAEDTVKIAKGSTLHRVRGAPRGQVFRVRTPLSALAVDHGYGAVAVGDQETVRIKTGKTVLDGKPLDANRQAVVTSSGRTERWMAPTEWTHPLEPPPRPPEDDMVYVPATRMTLTGWKRQRVEPFPDEKDAEKGIQLRAHDVKIDVEAYLIDRHEVTVGSIKAWLVACPRPNVFRRPTMNNYSGTHKGPGGDPVRYPDEMPAFGVPFDHAVEYARWVGKVLPTEAQWELAARGPKGFVYPWGNEPKNMRKKLEWRGPVKVEDVGVETPDVSPFGVTFMVTGSEEWCRELFDESPFRSKNSPPVPADDWGAPRPERGNLNSTRTRGRRGGDLGSGFRCVIELGRVR